MADLKQDSIKDRANQTDSVEHSTPFTKENTQVLEEMVGTYGKDKDDVVLTAVTLLYMIFQRTKTAASITVANKEKESYTFSMPQSDK